MQGSIKKIERKKGTGWWARIDVSDDYGNRKQLSKVFDTKKKAQRWLTEINHEYFSGTYIESSETLLSTFLNIWLEHYGETNLKVTTRADYKAFIKRHINPAIGHIPLNKVTPAILQEFYQRKLKRGKLQEKGGLSPATVKYHIHAPLSRAFESAIKWKMLSSNPANHVEIPNPTSKSVDFWEEDQIHMFLEYAKGHATPSQYMLFYTAIRTGLRRGELLGLRWQYIDFKQKALSVKFTITPTRDGTLHEGSPKTKSSQRVVSLDRELIEKLEQHHVRILKQQELLKDTWERFDLVFPSSVGTPINPSNLRRTFNRVIKKANLPKITFHDLRHCHATLMLKAGINPKIVSERLGHSSIKVTLDTYSHVLPHLQAEAAELFADLLREEQNK